MSRAISMTLALAASGVLLVAPFLLAHHLNGAVHGWATLMMVGITGAFVHGVGFVPRLVLLRCLFSPAVAWTLTIGPGAWLWWQG
jgi:predicted membrane protein